MMEYADRYSVHAVSVAGSYGDRRRSYGRVKHSSASRGGTRVSAAAGKRRHRVSGRVRLLILTFMISAISLICLSGFTSSGAAQSNEAERHKYYTAVYVDRDTTLWSIASEYMTEDYSSIRAYIREVKEINGISGDTIYYGSRLIVPYYSDDLY